MFNPTAAANQIIRSSLKKGKQLTPLQLIKLVYMAHGFSLAILNKPMISEPVQAWKHGPVVKSLYRKVKEYGRNPIVKSLNCSMLEGGVKDLDHESVELIDALVENWGDLSGIALSNWTHLPGSPWDQTYKSGVHDTVIPDDLIQDYFAEFLERKAISAKDSEASAA